MDLDEFFSAQKLSRQLFDAVRAAIDQTGTAKMHISKSQFAFRRRRGFAWVWIPARYLRRSNTAPLVLTLALPFRDPSPRWKQVVEPYPGCFIHHLEIYVTGEIDDWVRGRLALAWENGG